MWNIKFNSIRAERKEGGGEKEGGTGGAEEEGPQGEGM